MRRSILAFVLSAMAAILLSPAPALAQASFVCPTGPGPGERQVGWAGGSQGMAQVAICVSDGGGGGSRGPGRSDPMSEATNALLGVMAADHAYLEGLRKDPRYTNYMEGEWKFIDEPYQGQKMCGVAFLRLGQMVLLHGPGSAAQDGVMSFMDFRAEPLIPRPTGASRVRVVLTQNDEAPQTVVASNDTGTDGAGVLMLQVPTMQAMADSIDDAMKFKVEIDGKVVLQTAWQDGRKAREFLRACIGR